MKKIVIGVFLFLVTSAFAQFSIVKKADGYLIKEGNTNVLFYQKTVKSLDGKYPRSHYVHPLYTLDGEIITEDFPEDHPHHRGIFWAWHQVLIGDSSVADGWDCKNISWQLSELTELRNNEDQLRLKFRVFWTSPLWLDIKGREKAFVEETTFLTLYKSQPHYRSIDFEINLRALEPGVKIGGSDNKKGYGGFTIRTSVPEDLIFTSGDNIIEPKTLSINAGPWVNITGTFTDNITGIAILTHPAFPLVKQQWILRDLNLFKSAQNIRYPGRTPVVLTMDESIRLKYRIIIHEGHLSKSEIDTLYNNFIK